MLLLFLHTGGGRLGANSKCIIHIPSNDYPHGLFEISSRDGSGTIHVDESTGKT